MMVEIDERWDHLKAVRKAGYLVPKEQPDILPAHEAVLLWEHYREAQRLPEAARRGEKFLGLLRSAEAIAKETEELLRQFAAEPKPELHVRLNNRFDALGQSCVSCHKSFRDVAGPRPEGGNLTAHPTDRTDDACRTMATVSYFGRNSRENWTRRYSSRRTGPTSPA